MDEVSLLQSLSPQEYLAAFVHDELCGDVKNLFAYDFLRDRCKNQFYAMSYRGGKFNDVALKNIYKVLWRGIYDPVALEIFYYRPLFDLKELFGRVVDGEFSGVRRIGTEQVRVKARELVAIQNTIGNIFAFNSKRVGASFTSSGMDLGQYIDLKFPGRMDKFLVAFQRSISGGRADALLRELSKGFSFESTGQLDFNTISRINYLEDFRDAQGNTKQILPQTLNERNGSTISYLRSVEKSIDAIIALIRRRSEAIIVSLNDAMSAKEKDGLMNV